MSNYGPGKFEGCGSVAGAARVLYRTDPDEETGSVQENGRWYALFRAPPT